MIFPTAKVLTPCLTRRLSSEMRHVWKKRSHSTKKYGLRVGFGVIAGTECWTLVKEAAKGEVTSR